MVVVKFWAVSTKKYYIKKNYIQIKSIEQCVKEHSLGLCVLVYGYNCYKECVSVEISMFT